MSQLVKRDSELDKHESTQPRDPLFLFACHLEWRDSRNIKAYQELIAALDDPNEEIRSLAENLLHRSSPRPRRCEPANPFWGDLR